MGFMDAYDFTSVDDEHASHTLATRSSPPHRNNIQEDVLAEIFLLLSRDPNVTWPKRNMWDWVRVTEVCRYWRRVAIGTANLWAYLDTLILSSARRTVAFLLRSKDSDLTVYFDGRIDDFENVKIALKYHMRRIRHLTINMTLGQKNYKKLSEVLNQSAPRAQSMMVRLMYPSEKPYIHLLTTSSGVLQTLEVCWIDLSSSLARFSKLISLSITECSNFTLAELFAVLEASPNLSSLSVIACSIRDSVLTKTVCLQNLTSLVLDCFNFSKTYGILRNIEVQNLEYWKCKCREGLTGSDIAGLHVFSKLMELRGKYLDHMEINSSTNRGTRWIEMISHKKVSATYYKATLALPITSSIYVDADDEIVTDALQRLLEVYGNHIAKAKKLTIGDYDDLLVVDNWRKVFLASDCVDVVHTNIMNGEDYGMNCLIALGVHPHIHSGVELRVPCPKLDYIDISWNSQPSGSGSSFDAILSALEEVLRTRSVLGRAVRKVSFRSHGYVREDDRLRGFDRFNGFSRWVEELDWVCELMDLPDYE